MVKVKAIVTGSGVEYLQLADKSGYYPFVCVRCMPRHDSRPNSSSNLFLFSHPTARPIADLTANSTANSTTNSTANPIANPAATLTDIPIAADPTARPEGPIHSDRL